LEITDSFTAAADNEADCTIWHHNLETVLAFTESGLMTALCDFTSAASFTGRVASILLDNPIYFALCIHAGTRISGDPALALGSGSFRASYELDSGSGDFFNTAEIFTLTTDHKTHQR
jgi:hypothetical protein